MVLIINFQSRIQLPPLKISIKTTFQYLLAFYEPLQSFSKSWTLSFTTLLLNCYTLIASTIDCPLGRQSSEESETFQVSIVSHILVLELQKSIKYILSLPFYAFSDARRSETYILSSINRKIHIQWINELFFILFYDADPILGSSLGCERDIFWRHSCTIWKLIVQPSFRRINYNQGIER